MRAGCGLGIVPDQPAQHFLQHFALIVCVEVRIVGAVGVAVEVAGSHVLSEDLAHFSQGVTVKIKEAEVQLVHLLGAASDAAGGRDIDPAVASGVVAVPELLPAKESEDVLEIGVGIDYRVARSFSQKDLVDDGVQ